jgi:hypothetical protein
MRAEVSLSEPWRGRVLAWSKGQIARLSNADAFHDFASRSGSRPAASSFPILTISTNFNVIGNVR